MLRVFHLSIKQYNLIECFTWFYRHSCKTGKQSWVEWWCVFDRRLVHNFSNLPLSKSCEIHHFPLLFLSLSILEALCKKHWMNATFIHVFLCSKEGKNKNPMWRKCKFISHSFYLKADLASVHKWQRTCLADPWKPALEETSKTWSSHDSVGSAQFPNSKWTNVHIERCEWSHTGSTFRLTLEARFWERDVKARSKLFPYFYWIFL